VNHRGDDSGYWRRVEAEDGEESQLSFTVSTPKPNEQVFLNFYLSIFLSIFFFIFFFFCALLILCAFVFSCCFPEKAFLSYGEHSASSFLSGFGFIPSIIPPHQVNIKFNFQNPNLLHHESSSGSKRQPLPPFATRMLGVLRKGTYTGTTCSLPANLTQAYRISFLSNRETTETNLTQLLECGYPVSLPNELAVLNHFLLSIHERLQRFSSSRERDYRILNLNQGEVEEEEDGEEEQEEENEEYYLDSMEHEVDENGIEKELWESKIRLAAMVRTEDREPLVLLKQNLIRFWLDTYLSSPSSLVPDITSPSFLCGTQLQKGEQTRAHVRD
jgi:hypothetical protein